MEHLEVIPPFGQKELLSDRSDEESGAPHMGLKKDTSSCNSSRMQKSINEAEEH